MTFSCNKASVTRILPSDLVNPLAGTLSTFSFSNGNTYPAIGVPWGSGFWTPQTGANGDGWAYQYDKNSIRGFKHTHQPSPWMNDYGAFSLMPVTTGPYYDQGERASVFSHKTETARPYYYSVYLADHDTQVELTPTSHASCMRITYPEREISYLVTDAYDGGEVHALDNHTLVGYSVQNHGGVPDNFRNYFIVVCDTPFSVFPSSAQTALVGFHTAKGQQVKVMAATSFISAEQAAANLKEVDGKSFDNLSLEARDAWNEVLGRIEIKDGRQDRIETFYSCLYRALLFPRDISETGPDGKRIHYSPHTGHIEEGYCFTDSGFWDTFRALMPLLNLVYPELSLRIQESLVNDFLESGFLPEWKSPGHRNCMIGNNSASIVADAYLKGIRGQDMAALWSALTHGAHAVHPSVPSTGRAGFAAYDSLGYVPYDIGLNETAARTLEYAYDDWCILRLGEALGKSEEELKPYRKAALNYRNVFDPGTGLMNGRASDGTFRGGFNPLKWGGDFTEGNSLHYTWSVFHDIEGLAELMGGMDSFNATLDSVFEMPPEYDDSYYGFPIHEIVEMQVMQMGNYAHGNQPAQHMLYLYDWSGQPWKTQSLVREVMERFYSPAPDGYCGDEDNGQTSAWYVFSALGFYPVCPGSNEYAIGSPLFKSVTLHLEGGDLNILAPDNDIYHPYIREMKVNGRKVSRNFLRHEELVNGGDIRFKMSESPSNSRGTAEDDRPYSFSR